METVLSKTHSTTPTSQDSTPAEELSYWNRASSYLSTTWEQYFPNQEPEEELKKKVTEGSGSVKPEGDQTEAKIKRVVHGPWRPSADDKGAKELEQKISKAEQPESGNTGEETDEVITDVPLDEKPTTAAPEEWSIWDLVYSYLPARRVEEDTPRRYGPEKKKPENTGPASGAVEGKVGPKESGGDSSENTPRRERETAPNRQPPTPQVGNSTLPSAVSEENLTSQESGREPSEEADTGEADGSSEQSSSSKTPGSEEASAEADVREGKSSSVSSSETSTESIESEESAPTEQQSTSAESESDTSSETEDSSSAGQTALTGGSGDGSSNKRKLLTALGLITALMVVSGAGVFGLSQVKEVTNRLPFLKKLTIR